MAAVVLMVLFMTVAIAQEQEREAMRALEALEVEVDMPVVQEEPFTPLPACGPGVVHRNLARPWTEARYWQGAGEPCTLESAP